MSFYQQCASANAVCTEGYNQLIVKPSYLVLAFSLWIRVAAVSPMQSKAQSVVQPIYLVVLFGDIYKCI